MNPAQSATSAEPLAGEQLERRLEELLHQDRFPPPAGFLAAARVNEASLHGRAEFDPDEFWADDARRPHWDEPFTTVLDDSRPPFYKWFTDGQLNVSCNCIDRHVEGGRGNRVAFYWAGEEGEQLRDIAEGRALGDVTTLRDPAVMAELVAEFAVEQAKEE